MKKNLLLVLATTSLVFSQASADTMGQACDTGKAGTYYVKAFAGADKLNTVTVNAGVLDDIKIKSKISPFLGAGVGYYITDMVRADLTLDFLINSQFKASVSDIISDPSLGTLSVAATEKVKPRIGALLANAYVDMFDVGPVKVFAGAGIGASRVKTKINTNVSVTGIPSTATPAQIQAFAAANNFTVANGQVTASKSESFKAVNNFAYSLALGASAEVTPGITTELTYSWKDFGKAIKGVKASLKGHNLSVGLRFDI